MNFRLEKSTASTKTLAKFNVVDDQRAICGVISVPVAQAADLQKHWLGGGTSPPTVASGGKQNRMVSALMSASKKRVPTKQQAILRGC